MNEHDHAPMPAAAPSGPVAGGSAPHAGPFHASGPLGPVTVYPDNDPHAPADAIRASDYQRMVDVFGRIENGTSRLRLLPDGASQQQRDQNWNNYFFDSKGRRGAGGPIIIMANPDLRTWDASAESCEMNTIEPWMRDRDRLGFYHELVHAHYYTQGMGAPEAGGYSACVDDTQLGKWEFQATGIGPYAGERVSENAIRGQMHLPHRPTYGGARYGRKKNDRR